MKLTLYYSGGPRTATHTIPLTISKIKEKNPNIIIDVKYSFWKSLERKNKKDDSSTGLYGINDPWHYEAQDVRLDESLLNESEMNKVFVDCEINSAEGEFEDLSKMKEVMENSPSTEGGVHNGVWSQNYRVHRVAEKFPMVDSDWGLRIRPDVLLGDFPDLSTLKSSLILNHYYWFKAVNRGIPPNMCNETFWLANKDVFLLTNSIYNHREEITQLGLDCGERMTAAFFRKLFEEGQISIDFFDFKYRVAR